MSAVMEEKKEPLSSFRDRFGLERRGGEGGGGGRARRFTTGVGVKTWTTIDVIERDERVALNVAVNEYYE
jgi:hypothetical protein